MKKIVLLTSLAVITFANITDSLATGIITYDEYGNKIKEEFWYNGTKNTEYRYTYENGNMTKKEYYHTCSSGTCTKYSENVYTYTDGNMTKEEYYDHCSSGTCKKSSEERYTYEGGNMTKQESYSCSSSGTCTTSYGEDRYTYEGGNIAKKESYRNCTLGKCKKSSEDIYTYEDGNMTKKEHYYCPSGTCNKSSENLYAYTDGNMTKDEYYYCSSGTCKKSTEDVYTYTDGNMTKDEYYYCSSGTCTKSTENIYTYDEYGNVITDGEAIHEYPIEYYKNLEQKCSSAGNCTICTKWSSLEGGKCIPGYEWIDENTIAINDDLPIITRDIFNFGDGLPNDLKIVCRGDATKCDQIMANYPIATGCSFIDSGDHYTSCTPVNLGVSSSGDPYYVGTRVNVDMGYYVNAADSSNCESGRYYWSGSSCNNKNSGINCDENFKQMETWCNRVHYTPAEAAKVLKDTDNEIIMTFKVNR